MAAHQPGGIPFGFDRRIAHQVDTVQVRAAVFGHAAWINDRDHQKPDVFQLLFYHRVPMQAADKTFHKRKYDLSADAFDAMNAADNSKDWRVRFYATHFNDIKRQMFALSLYVRRNPDAHVLLAFTDQVFQLGQFREGCFQTGNTLNHSRWDLMLGARE